MLWRREVPSKFDGVQRMEQPNRVVIWTQNNFEELYFLECILVGRLNDPKRNSRSWTLMGRLY